MVADRNSLQRQLTAVTAAHEAETRQLHADKTGLQVRHRQPEEKTATHWSCACMSHVTCLSDLTCQAAVNG